MHMAGVFGARGRGRAPPVRQPPVAPRRRGGRAGRPRGAPRTLLALVLGMAIAPSHVTGPVSRRQLLALARERFGVDRFRPGQLALMEAILAGRSALGILP